MPSSPASEEFHFAHRVPNFPPGSSHSIVSLCGAVVSTVYLTMEASKVDCEHCRAKLDSSVTLRLTNPEYRRSVYCPKCGSADITDASQSLDCNACGHSW